MKKILIILFLIVLCICSNAIVVRHYGSPHNFHNYGHGYGYGHGYYGWPGWWGYPYYFPPNDYQCWEPPHWEYDPISGQKYLVPGYYAPCY